MKHLFKAIKEEVRSWDRESVLFVVAGVVIACLVLKMVV